MPKAQKFTSYLVNGQYLKRVAISKDNKENCKECDSRPGTNHGLGCIFEKSPCGIHEYAVSCDCDHKIGEAV